MTKEVAVMKRGPGWVKGRVRGCVYAIALIRARSCIHKMAKSGLLPT
jgi:hypothetical protein